MDCMSLPPRNSWKDEHNVKIGFMRFSKMPLCLTIQFLKLWHKYISFKYTTEEQKPPESYLDVEIYDFFMNKKRMPDVFIVSRQKIENFKFRVKYVWVCLNCLLKIFYCGMNKKRKGYKTYRMYFVKNGIIQYIIFVLLIPFQLNYLQT